MTCRTGNASTAVLWSAVLFFGCSESTLDERTATSIGARGGTLKSAEGGAELTVPSGALARDVEVTIEVQRVQRNSLLTPIYEFAPADLEFSTPATITLAVQAPEGSRPVLARIGDARAQEVTDSRYDGRFVVGSIERLSEFGAFRTGAACTADGDCLAAERCAPSIQQCVPAQPPPPCSATEECAAGEICHPQLNLCVPALPDPTCQADADCDPNTVCHPVAGVCVPGSTTCNADPDCGPHQVCTSGICAVAGPNRCAANAECSPGESCVAGFCIPWSPVQCQSDADCRPNRRCDPALQACVPTVPTCDGGTACAPGEVCVHGMCFARGPVQCATDTDCAAGDWCEPHANLCIPGGLAPCSSDGDCPPGIVCFAYRPDEPTAGICVPGAPQRCQTDADCPAPSICNPRAEFCVPG